MKNVSLSRKLRSSSSWRCLCEKKVTVTSCSEIDVWMSIHSLSWVHKKQASSLSWYSSKEMHRQGDQWHLILQYANRILLSKTLVLKKVVNILRSLLFFLHTHCFGYRADRSVAIDSLFLETFRQLKETVAKLTDFRFSFSPSITSLEKSVMNQTKDDRDKEIKRNEEWDSRRVVAQSTRQCKGSRSRKQ